MTESFTLFGPLIRGHDYIYKFTHHPPIADSKECLSPPSIFSLVAYIPVHPLHSKPELVGIYKNTSNTSISRPPLFLHLFRAQATFSPPETTSFPPLHQTPEMFEPLPAHPSSPLEQIPFKKL